MWRIIHLLFLLLPNIHCLQTFRHSDLNEVLSNTLTDSEYVFGRMTGRFGSPPWVDTADLSTTREGKKANNFKNSRLWPNARVPYEVANTIDLREWNIIQRIFANISSVTNIEFIPRTAKDTDYLLITEDIETYGCGCCSIGVGYLEGSGAHVMVLAPVKEGGCGVNHIGGTHEMLHILGLTHVQNRPDRCNYIDVDTSLLTGWGEWRVNQISPSADWFSLRIPYDCSSYIHYYQLQGAVWKKEIMDKVDQYMESQGCESFQRGEFINKCLVSGGYTEGGRIIKDGYDKCLDQWDKKHMTCVENVIQRFPTFRNIDPNGRCKKNGINKTKRKSHQISQWDIWALNAAYGGPLPICQKPKTVGDGICDPGNNNIGCEYDGGDCCLPNASPFHCIDPCGVRLKFYNGTNRPCRKAPESEAFCRDHYWYGPNRCDDTYCSVADEKFLQWQCKKTCNLCNVDPSRKEMDEVCDAFISAELKAKYKQPLSKNKPNKNVEKITDIDFKKKTTTASPRNSSKKSGKNAPQSNVNQLQGGKSSKATQQSSKPSKPSVSVSTKQSSNPSESTKQSSKPSLITKQSSNPSVITKQSLKQPQQQPLRKANNKQKPSRRNNNNRRNKQNRNQGSSRRPGKQETPRSGGGRRSGGFIVISSPERRLAMRSYWMRTG